MKKYKWIINLILYLIILLVTIFLGSIKFKNIDMTETRLFITYWKEYLIGGVIILACYISSIELFNK